MVNGCWKEVTQMTRMGNVSKVVVGQGKRPILFHGAIVAFGNPDDRECDAVSESYFRIEVLIAYYSAGVNKKSCTLHISHSLLSLFHDVTHNCHK